MPLRFLLVLLFVFFFIVPVQVMAAPWVPPGDARLRSALEWLGDRGCLSAPVTTWPLMWADVQLTSDATGRCEASLAWQYVHFERAWAARAATGALSLAGANQAAAVHTFADQPREKESVKLSLDMRSQHFALGLSPAFVPEPYGLNRHHAANLWRWDGSYLASSVGNWVLGVGAIDRWWGPGWRASLILGSNSRPVPAVFLNRGRAQASRWPLLKWLGPWTFTAFAGQLESDRVVARTKLLGMRMGIKPTHWLELGISRTTQWGGEGRPESWTSFRDMLFGSDNYYSDFQQEPGNQLGGVDMRVGLPFGQTSTASVYGQLIGEDEANKLPSRTICQLGASLSGHWLPGRQQLRLEYSDTEVDRWRGEALPNVAYEHHIYRNGYRYYGRSLGAGWDNDSQVLSLGWRQFFTNGNEFGVTIDSATLNKDGRIAASSALSPVPVMAAQNAENLTFYRLDYHQPLWQGRLSLSASWMSRPLVTVAQTYDRATFMASWEYRFEM